MKFTVFITAISIILIAFSIIQLKDRINKLEQFYNLKLDKLTFTCNHVVAVMTPEGYATTVCAP